MKEKIIERLRALFPNVNLSKERLDAIADKLAAKITDETQIDEKINDLNEVISFSDIAKQDDKVRTLEAEAKKKATTPNDQPKPDNDPPTDPPKDDTPSWAKALIEKVESLEKGKVASTRREQVLSKLKDADEKYRNRVLRDFDRMKIDSDDDFNQVLSDIEADFVDFRQEKSNDGLGNDTPFGAFGPSGKDQASEKEVESIVDSILK